MGASQDPLLQQDVLANRTLRDLPSQTASGGSVSRGVYQTGGGGGRGALPMVGSASHVMHIATHATHQTCTECLSQTWGIKKPEMGVNPKCVACMALAMHAILWRCTPCALWQAPLCTRRRVPCTPYTVRHTRIAFRHAQGGRSAAQTGCACTSPSTALYHGRPGGWRIAGHAPEGICIGHPSNMRSLKGRNGKMVELADGSRIGKTVRATPGTMTFGGVGCR
jgi:hypothetical protein